MSLLKVVSLMTLSISILSGCNSDNLEPPVAQIHPHEMTIHGDTRIDNYFWMNDREDPEVLAYLNAENNYTKEVLAHTEAFQKSLFDEIKGRIKENESTAPYEMRGYWYYERYVSGGEYALHCRRQGSMDGQEEILFDGNKMAEGKGYFALSTVQISTNSKLAVFGIDSAGRRFYTLGFKNLETGEILADSIPDVTANVVWANDNKTIFYARQDPNTLRSFQIWRHELGTEIATDMLVYQEDEDTFDTFVTRTKSDRFLIIGCTQTLSTEYRTLDANNPQGEFRLFQLRQPNLEYEIDHQGDRFLILTNHEAKNFRLMECGLLETGIDHWQEVIPHRRNVLLEDIDVFADFLVLNERFDGLNHLKIIPTDGTDPHFIDFGEPTWDAGPAFNPQMDSTILRFWYSSLKTPGSTFAYDMKTRSKTLLKQDAVLGGFVADEYESQYLHAPARDGVRVPVSLVYKKGITLDGNNPLLLYAYGSYGYSMDARFNSARLSLLDRGFVFAIAHIRGGQEMGRQWYEDGKLLRKKNTFNDFIDCGHFLVESGYTSAEKLFAMGGSAGGLLMGAVVNMEPKLWRGVVAQVPWVDVVTTMLDASIPLTTSEYDEWGNPEDKVYYDYMLSYSPYDQVSAQDYPAMLVTTGLNDSQVQYFEPTKWVAKLRAQKTDNNMLLLKINMEAGHGGASGRFRSLEETALSYAFMFDLIGVTK